MMVMFINLLTGLLFEDVIQHLIVFVCMPESSRHKERRKGHELGGMSCRHREAEKIMKSRPQAQEV